MNTINSLIKNPWNWVKLAWFQAIVATLGSLYFSEVMGYPPCALCWYQRIAMYPMAALLGVAIFRKDVKYYLYTLFLALPGFFIAIFHNAKYWAAQVSPQTFDSCAASGVSCTSKQVEWFGFITIPLLSLTAFAVILFCTAMYYHLAKKQGILNGK